MSIDDELDDLLDADRELEAAFRDLTAQADLDALKRRGKTSSQGRTRARSKPSGSSKPEEKRPNKKKTTRSSKPDSSDPLGDLKAALDGDAPAGKRYVVVVCPSCSAKNRVPLERLRTKVPVCGRCKTDLSFLR